MAHSSSHHNIHSVTIVKPPPPLNVKKGAHGWNLFKQMWANYCMVATTRLNDETYLRSLFLHTMGVEGMTVYSRMQLPDDRSVGDIISAFDDYFCGGMNEACDRYVFNTREQKADETVEDYIAALRCLASTCNFCDCLKDGLLRDRIILGIKDSSTRKRLLQEAHLNLETCITMCRDAENTSPSQSVKTVTRTEDTTAVQAGSVSSGDQRPGSKQDFSQRWRHCDKTASPDEEEMTDINFNADTDDSEDSALQWTIEQLSSGIPGEAERTKHFKLEPAWPMEEDSPDQPSAVYSTAQPMSDNTSRSLLSLKRGRVCQRCSAAFVLVSSLELHLASVHGESLTPDRFDFDNLNNADIDGEVDSHSNSKTTTEETFHRESDQGEKNTNRQHACNICGKSFRLPCYLARHKMSHISYECDMCNKTFLKAHRLRTHMRVHTGHRPFACNVCGKRFTQYGNMNRHRIIHTGKRPYKCPHCNADFNQSSSLRTHIRTVHADDRPYVCDVCGDDFAVKATLAGHMQRHTGEKPHVCSDCGKGFTKPSSLKQHRVIHTGEKPHSCVHCPAVFRWSADLKKHIDKMHQ